MKIPLFIRAASLALLYATSLAGPVFADSRSDGKPVPTIIGHRGGKSRGARPDHQNVSIRLHITPHTLIISATTSRHAAAAIADGLVISRRNTPDIDGNTSEVSSSIFPSSSAVENG